MTLIELYGIDANDKYLDSLDDPSTFDKLAGEIQLSRRISLYPRRKVKHTI